MMRQTSGKIFHLTISLVAIGVTMVGISSILYQHNSPAFYRYLATPGHEAFAKLHLESSDKKLFALLQYK